MERSPICISLQRKRQRYEKRCRQWDNSGNLAVSVSLCLGPESGPNPNACRNPVFVCAGASSVPLEREARRKRQLSCHLFGFINIFGLLRTTLESRVEN